MNFPSRIHLPCGLVCKPIKRGEDIYLTEITCGRCSRYPSCRKPIDAKALDMAYMCDSFESEKKGEKERK